MKLHGYASRFSKVTRLQRLRKLQRAMSEDSQRLQGLRSYEVTQNYDWRLSKVTSLQKLWGCAGLYQPKYQRCKVTKAGLPVWLIMPKLRGYESYGVTQCYIIHSLKSCEVTKVAKVTQGFPQIISDVIKVRRLQKFRCFRFFLLLKDYNVTEVMGLHTCTGLYHPHNRAFNFFLK